MIGLRHQHLHVLADCLRGRVAEEPFGRGIEGFHQTVLVNRDDAVDGMVHNGA